MRIVFGAKERKRSASCPPSDSCLGVSLVDELVHSRSSHQAFGSEGGCVNSNPRERGKLLWMWMYWLFLVQQYISVCFSYVDFFFLVHFSVAGRLSILGKCGVGREEEEDIRHPWTMYFCVLPGHLCSPPPTQLVIKAKHPPACYILL